ncbi:MAG: ABC transporter permease [Rhodospirillales bacterium]
MTDTTQGLKPDSGLDAVRRVAAAQARVARRGLRARWGLVAPALLIIAVFGIGPLLITVVYSFLEAATYGGVIWNFSFDAYVQFLFERDIFDETLHFSWSYPQIFGRSILLALVTTVFCVLVGFPTAYFMATRPPSQRNLWLFLITLPFWTNLLIRTYAIFVILRDEGLVNNSLMWIGIIPEPLRIIHTDFAVCIGLMYSFLPFMVLPLYAALEKMDFRLVEAGYDLYANRWQVLRRVVLPIAKPGLVAGCILVFIPSIGAYVTPLLLGGGKELMIGNLIALQFGNARNWPFGCAAALILMGMVLIALLYYVRSTGAKQGLGHG